MDLLDYSTSIFNPGLKLLVFLIFFGVTIVYWDIRRYIGGRLQSCISLLLLFSFFMMAGALFRYFGHGEIFGFNSDYSLKWFQSLAYLVGCIFLIGAGYRLLTIFSRRER